MKPIPLINSADIEQLVRLVCEVNGVDYEELMSPSRNDELILVRFIISHIMCTHMHMTTSRVGKAINRDHATVMNHIRKCDNMMDTNRMFVSMYNISLKHVYSHFEDYFKLITDANNFKIETATMDSGAKGAGRSHSKLQQYVSVCEMAQAKKRKTNRQPALRM